MLIYTFSSPFIIIYTSLFSRLSRSMVSHTAESRCSSCISGNIIIPLAEHFTSRESIGCSVVDRLNTVSSTKLAMKDVCYWQKVQTDYLKCHGSY